MQLASLFLKDQMKAIIQAKAMVSVLSDESYASTRQAIETNTRFKVPGWIARMTAQIAEARAAMTDQGLLDAEWEDSNQDVRTHTDSVREWREDVRAVLEWAVTAEIEGAAKTLSLWNRVQPAGTSYEDELQQLPTLIDQLTSFDRDAFDLPDALLEEGRRLLGLMEGERSDADGAKGGRATETDRLRVAIFAIAKLAEERAAAHYLAGRRVGRELPGLDLTYLRAAVRAYTTPAAPAPTAPETLPNGL